MSELQQLKFEDALKELEKVVRSLEQGEVPLEQALDLFQQGIGLVKICSNKLDEAEKQIQILLEGAEGELKLTQDASLEEGA